MNAQEINELTDIVNDHLSQMTETSHPYFWPMLATEEGTQKAQQLIVTYAMNNQTSVGEAIGLLESTMTE